ncbi:MAG: hypothetical protein ACTTIA_01730 [Candidatus Cryptobacteroides sp.]
MIKHLILKISSLLLLSTAIIIAFASCCKIHGGKGTLQPEWETRIPTGSSKVIFYDGLPVLPKYKDWIIAHTTIVDEFFKEDNRLCAVNLNTGLVDWLFPKNTEERHYCHFGANSYQYKNKLVFQYQKDARTYESRDLITTVCIDLETQEIIWEKTNISTYRNYTNVVGDDKNCYFLNGENDLCWADLVENKQNVLFNIAGEYFYRLSLTSDGNLLLFSFEKKKIIEEENYSINYARIIAPNTGKEKYKKLFLPPKDSWSRRMKASGFEKDGVIYGNIDTYIAAIDIKSDKTLWEREDYWAHTAKDLFEYGGVLLKCGINATTGYNAKTGEILYDYRDYGSNYATQQGQYVYLLTCKGFIDIIDIKSGTKLDYIKCKYDEKGESFLGSYPTLIDGKMYIMSYNHLFRYPTYPW